MIVYCRQPWLVEKSGRAGRESTHSGRVRNTAIGMVQGLESEKSVEGQVLIGTLRVQATRQNRASIFRKIILNIESKSMILHFRSKRKWNNVSN